MESLAGVCAAPVAGETVDVVFEVGALDKYFCFISSVVNDAPVLRIPDPPELSEPVLESDEALLVAGVWVSVEVLLAGIGLRGGSSASRSGGASLVGGCVGVGVCAGGRSSTGSVAGVAAVLFCFLILEISSSSLVCRAIAVGTFLTCT